MPRKKKFVVPNLKEMILGREDGTDWPIVLIPRSLSDRWWVEAARDQELKLHSPTIREGFWIRVWNYVRQQRGKMLEEMRWR